MSIETPTELPLAALASIVGDAQVSVDLALRRLVSCDVFPWDDAPLVAVVVSPATTAEVAAVVRLADAHGIAVAPRGGGVSYTRGYVPARERTLLLDFSRMRAVRDVNVEDRHVTVGPGCTWQQLDEACAAHGLRPAMRGPISGSHATVCGSVAQNSGSASMAAILALEVVVADGRVVHTGSSAVAAHPSPFLRHFGPDLAGLFIGDSGALGIKTACTLALEPRPAGTAFASLAFESLAAMTRVMVDVTRSGIPCRLLGMDPLKNRTAARVGLREGLGTLANVVRSAGSVATGLRQAARIAAAGQGVLDDVPWSLHVTVEGHDQVAADHALAALRALWAGTRELPASVPMAMQGRPYSIRGIVGLAGERWIPVHGLFPLSQALQVVARTEALLAQHARRLQSHAIDTSFIVTSAGASWLLEPMFYWPDELGPLHAAVLGDKYAKFAGAPPNPAARAVVRELRGEIARLFDGLGGLHSQLGKYYAYRERLEPDTWSVLTDLKKALDPRGTLNPGNLGWD